MAKAKKMRKPKLFDIKKFVDAGWEFSCESVKTYRGLTKYHYFKSPRLTTKYRFEKDFEDSTILESELLERELELYKQYLLRKATSEMYGILSDNIDENISILKV